jgi:hypothetical protein
LFLLKSLKLKHLSLFNIDSEFRHRVRGDVRGARRCDHNEVQVSFADQTCCDGRSHVHLHSGTGDFDGQLTFELAVCAQLKPSVDGPLLCGCADGDCRGRAEGIPRRECLLPGQRAGDGKQRRRNLVQGQSQSRGRESCAIARRGDMQNLASAGVQPRDACRQGNNPARNDAGVRVRCAVVAPARSNQRIGVERESSGGCARDRSSQRSESQNLRSCDLPTNSGCVRNCRSPRGS